MIYGDNLDANDEKSDENNDDINKEMASEDGLHQGWANYGPQAACSPPSHFLRPANNFAEFVRDLQEFPFLDLRSHGKDST